MEKELKQGTVIDLEDGKSVIQKNTLRDKLNGWVNELLLEQITDLEHREQQVARREKIIEDIMSAVGLTGNIKIVVGNQPFYVHSSVLEKFPDSYFCAMLSGAIEAVNTPDPYVEKTFFVARNPKVFAIILDYLQYGVLRESLLSDELHEMVLCDARFFKLKELEDLLDVVEEEEEEEEELPKEKKRKPKEDPKKSQQVPKKKKKEVKPESDEGSELSSDEESDGDEPEPKAKATKKAGVVVEVEDKKKVSTAPSPKKN